MTYYLAKGMTDKRFPWLVFIFVMGYLLIKSLKRPHRPGFFNLGYETTEIAGPQVVLVIKLNTFTWNIYDGDRRSPEGLDKWQLGRPVTGPKFPFLLDFLGYTSYFPGSFVAHPWNTHTTRWLSRNCSRALRPLGTSTTLVSYQHDFCHLVGNASKYKLVTGFVCLGLFVTLCSRFSYAETLRPWFGRVTLAERLLPLQIAGFFERCKHYTIQTLTEGAAIITGFGFAMHNEEDKTLWDGAANIRVLNIKVAEKFKKLFDSWNVKTNVRLRECVYKRVTKKRDKPGFKSSMMTFTVSAIWYGVSRLLFPIPFRRFSHHSRPSGPLNRPPTVHPVPGQPATPPSFNRSILRLVGGNSDHCARGVNYAAAAFMLLTIGDSWSVSAAWDGTDASSSERPVLLHGRDEVA